jgi:hypothetical protein
MPDQQQRSIGNVIATLLFNLSVIAFTIHVLDGSSS